MHGHHNHNHLQQQQPQNPQDQQPGAIMKAASARRNSNSKIKTSHNQLAAL